MSILNFSIPVHVYGNKQSYEFDPADLIKESEEQIKAFVTGVKEILTGEEWYPLGYATGRKSHSQRYFIRMKYTLATDQGTNVDINVEYDFVSRLISGMNHCVIDCAIIDNEVYFDMEYAADAYARWIQSVVKDKLNKE